MFFKSLLCVYTENPLLDELPLKISSKINYFFGKITVLLNKRLQKNSKSKSIEFWAYLKISLKAAYI
jgi:hypothetical protein